VSRRARITGLVEYREGEGARIAIRQGPCDVQVTALDATISWVDGDSHGSTAIPIADFMLLLQSQAIQYDEPAGG